MAHHSCGHCFFLLLSVATSAIGLHVGHLLNDGASVEAGRLKADGQRPCALGRPREVGLPPLPQRRQQRAKAPLLRANTSVHFIRIQKTAGTTFGEKIMRKFCGPESDLCRGFLHMDYAEASKGGPGVKLVTLLRDPVERTLSEFFYIRSPEGKTNSRQKQWDFHNDTWLRLVQGMNSTDEALSVYLHGYPGSPSRNRQALYLMGFKHNEGKFVDWDGRHRELLALAKSHLDEVAAFGFTECFTTSVGTIAETLGWDARGAMKLATDTHERMQNKVHNVAEMKRGRSPAWPQLWNQVLVGDFLEDAVTGKWATLVSADVVRDVERLNSVDMELHRYALEQYHKRFGKDCVAVR